MHLTQPPDLPKTSIEWNREEYFEGMECSFRHQSRVLFRYFTINIIHQTTHIHIHTAQWPRVPSISQSLKPSTINGDVSKGVKHPRVGRNIQNKQTNKKTGKQTNKQTKSWHVFFQRLSTNKILLISKTTAWRISLTFREFKFDRCQTKKCLFTKWWIHENQNQSQSEDTPVLTVCDLYWPVLTVCD